MPTLEEEYKQYMGSQGVNDMYEAQKKSQLAGLESAYQQNLSNAQAARDAIPRQYQERANDLAVQYERNRRNLDQQANANGLNTGAGSQMQLALGSNYNRDYGGIRTAQQQAIDQADRGIRDLQTAYNNSVQQAVADNDFRRTQALLADYQQRYQQQLQTAQNLSQWGDFSGYNGIPGYSNEAITNMQNVWQASNPDLAYRTGRITAEQYHAMTGAYPAGYSAPSSGEYYYDGPSETPKTEDGDEPEKGSSPLLNWLGNTPVGQAWNWLVDTAKGNDEKRERQQKLSDFNERAATLNMDPHTYLNYMVENNQISREEARRIEQENGG